MVLLSQVSIMRCPCPCYECGDVVELSDLSFRVRCDCHPDDGCEHGICDECLTAYVEEDAK